MFANHLLTAWRNLRKNKTNSLINVFGLTVAFACCILLFLTVHFEFSYDGFHKNLPNLYQTYGISYTPHGDEKGASMAMPAAPTFKAEVPGVLASTAFMNGSAGIRYKGKEVTRGVTLVDDDFFSMFSFKTLKGTAIHPLGSESDVVLSQSTAQAVFSTEDPIGKQVQIKIGPNWKDVIVSAVLEDAPDNSTLQYSILARIELADNYATDKNNWDSQNHPVFLLLDPRVSLARVDAGFREVLHRHRAQDQARLKSEGYRTDAYGNTYAFHAFPFSRLHFDNEVGEGHVVSKNYLYILVLIGVVVLCIACFNFINLNVARAFTRAREVGIRKAIGAGKKQIFLQLWAESFLLCLGAVALASLAAGALLTPFNALFVEKLHMSALQSPGVIGCIATGMVLVSFLAGGYPAILVSRFQAVEVLKGKVSIRSSRWLRDGLITFQFVMAGLLICGTIVIYLQFEHLRKAPLGFSQESVISIPVKSPEHGQEYASRLRQYLSSQPQVLSVTGCSANIGIGEDHSSSRSHWTFDYQGKSIQTDMLNVDYDFLKTLGIPLRGGRDFSLEYPADTSADDRKIVVSERMAKEFGVPDPVGYSFYPDTTGPRWTIVGVFPDIHIFSMQTALSPLSLMLNSPNNNYIGYILLKVRTDNPIQTLAMVRNAYKTIEPDDPYGATYMTENTRRWYDSEQRLSSIFFTSAGIAVALSCLGLFAIVTLVVQQRRKEIGVRKVLGASVPGLTGLLSRDFLGLVGLAWLIACPVAGFFLHRWLQGFLYRISLEWWVFPLTGITMALIALSTVSVQTLRSALANPVKSLRTE